MIKGSSIVLIREFCLDRAISILAVSKEVVTLKTHLEVAEEIENFLLREVDTQKAQLEGD